MSLSLVHKARSKSRRKGFCFAEPSLSENFEPEVVPERSEETEGIKLR